MEKRKRSLCTSLAVVFVLFVLINFSFGSTVGYWGFEGDTVDIIGGNDGVLNGDASIVNDSTKGLCLALDGDRDYVQCGDIDGIDLYSNQDVTWAGWFRFDQTQNWGVLMDKRGCINGSWKGLAAWCNPTDNHVVAKLYAGNSEFSIQGSPVSYNTWHHVAIVCDRSGELTMYLNGSYDASIDISSVESDDLSTSRDFTLGYKADPESRYTYFDGQMDDIYVFDHALSELEVQALVPEPATLLLLGLGLGLIRKRI